MGQGEMILVVEDDYAVRQVVAEMLKHLGYRPLTAPNGKAALEIYEQHRDDIVLVITDAVMPEMDGLRLVEALRQRGSSVKVIVLSGYPLREGWQEIWGEEVIGWLSKPILLEPLSQMIRRALAEETSAKEA